MIGLVTGLGTRAGNLVYSKFIESWVANNDEDWPEIMVINICPVFGKDAVITAAVITKLKQAIEMMRACSSVFVACNTIHSYKDLWFSDNCVDWTAQFEKNIPADFVRYGSKTSADNNLYDVVYSEEISELISCYIGSKTKEKTMMAKATWDNIQVNNSKIALCCTELSLALAQFGCNEDVTVLDCSDFLVKMMVSAYQETL